MSDTGTRKTPERGTMRFEIIPASKLKPWKDNPRRNAATVDAVCKSIEAFGFNVPIVCDEHFRILAGHARRKAALKLGLKKVPVVVVSMAKRRQEAFAITDNQTARIARWDDTGLRRILNKIKKQDVSLGTLGFSRAQLEALLTPPTDFPWTLFDKEMATEPERPYGLLPVKLPRTELERAKKAVGAFAIRAGLRERDKAVLAGKVLMAALGMRAPQ